MRFSLDQYIHFRRSESASDRIQDEMHPARRTTILSCPAAEEKRVVIYPNESFCHASPYPLLFSQTSRLRVAEPLSSLPAPATSPHERTWEHGNSIAPSPASCYFHKGVGYTPSEWSLSSARMTWGLSSRYVTPNQSASVGSTSSVAWPRAIISPMTTGM